MTVVAPGQMNTFIPNHEESGRLTVDFSRNPSKFALNKYTQVVPIEKPEGYYLKMTLEERGRVPSDTLLEYAWADGQDAPTGVDGKESFEYIAFRALRYAYPFQLGHLSVQNATWDILSQHADIHAQKAMTARTVAALKVLTTTANYGTHTATATAIAGGTWDAATTANPYIRKCIDYAVDLILTDTLAVVGPEDLNLVINPTMAKEMAQSQEIADYVKGSPFALAYLKGDLEGNSPVNRRFGLPETYAGVNLVVEDAVKVTSRKGATLAKSYALAAATPFITARPGGLVGMYGGPSYSSCTGFVVKGDEMAVETMQDTNNRRVTGRVVDHFVYAMTAGITGFAFTGTT